MSGARAWIEQVLWARCRPLCLEMDTGFVVRSLHGDATAYGLELEVGEWACPQLPVLYGLDPTVRLSLDLINLPNGSVVDLSLEPDGDGCRLLLLDARQRHDEVQETQQQHHDVELLRQKLDRSSAQLRAALEEAERANAAKSRFIASMSHEFRTPLTAIQGYADRLLKLHPDSGDAAAVRRATRYLVTLVDNLLEQGRINASEIIVQSLPTQLEQLITDLREMFTPLTERRGLELRIKTAPDLPAWVELDETRLRQIAVNLLGNACKFTEQGFVGLHLSWRDGRLVLAVEDSGPGVSPANVERIFTAFERVDEDAPGVGLGLAISRQLAQRMGGDLKLESTLGEGSCFTLTVLAARCADPALAVPDTALDILLAEDDDALALLFSVVLRERGHCVERARSVPEAIEMAHRIQPRCLITDLNLPGGSGLDLIQSVRQSGFNGRLITLTGSTDARDRERALSAGADYFVSKPIDLSRLAMIVHAQDGDA